MAKDIRVAIRLDTTDFDRGIRSAQNSVQGLSRDISGIASAVGIALGTREIIAYVNEWQNMQNRIRAVFDTTNEQVRAFNDIKNIAGETRSSLADVADLYTKVKISGDALKLTQTEIAQVTETFTKALKASGTGAAQTSAAILQFGQALASGKLQGDEFRSLMENAPVFMRKLSEAVGVPIGDLKKLASEGAITSEVILAATQEMADGIDDKFAKTNTTISDLLVQTQNTIIETFGKLEEETGILNAVFTVVGKNIIQIIAAIGTAMVISFGASMIRNITTIVAAIGTAVGVFKQLRLAIATAAAAQGFMIGLTGAGLALVAAAGAAAAAAYYGLTKMFDSADASAAKQDNTVKDLTESLRESTSQTRLSAKEALAAGKAKVQAEKDAAKAAREAAAEARRIARERDRDLERARDQLISIKEQTQSIQEQYDLDVKRLFLTSEEADLQQKLLDLQKERRRQLAEVAKLERLTPSERAAQEQEINDIFDDRLSLVKATGGAMILLRAAMDYTSQKRNIEAESAAFAVNLETRKKLLTEFNSFNIQKITEIGKIEEDYKRQREILEGQSRERLAAMVKAGDLEAQEREKANLQNTIGYLDKIKQAQTKSAEDRIAAEKTFYEESRSFAQGWAEAYGQYFEQLRVTVEDQAGYAKRIFNTITDGFTNSIMKFVETGKLSFKDLFKSLMMEIIKMQVNKFFLSIFGKGGPMGSLFAGLFADGGKIPAGKYGIAGEAGPELIRGPANVVSTKDTAAILGGSTGANPAPTMVTYNINATDARSFKELVAADPAFIYNVTTLGARRIPR